MDLWSSIFGQKLNVFGQKSDGAIAHTAHTVARFMSLEDPHAATSGALQNSVSISYNSCMWASRRDRWNTTARTVWNRARRAGSDPIRNLLQHDAPGSQERSAWESLHAVPHRRECVQPPQTTCRNQDTGKTDPWSALCRLLKLVVHEAERSSCQMKFNKCSRNLWESSKITEKEMKMPGDTP